MSWTGQGATVGRGVPLMTLVLISLGLVVLVNVVGGLVAAGRRAFAGRR